MELPSDYKEAEVFNHELQQAKDISEKASLGNLFRSSLQRVFAVSSGGNKKKTKKKTTGKKKKK